MSRVDVDRPAFEGGGTAVTDAAMLPGGRMLAAAGEHGAFLLSSDGEVIARFGEPADTIVISDQGDRAILLYRAESGDLYRLSRLDLVTSRREHWCDARITRYAPDYDGSVWFVSRGDTLFALDAAAADWTHPWKDAIDARAGWTHLWEFSEPGIQVDAIARDARWMSVHVVPLFHNQPARMPAVPGAVRTYELPSVTLRRRQPVKPDPEGFGMYGVAAVSPVAHFSGGRFIGRMGRPMNWGQNSTRFASP